MAERFSTFVGSVTGGIITTVLFDIGEIRYRIALISMAVFILIGLIIVRKIPVKVKET